MLKEARDAILLILEKTRLKTNKENREWKKFICFYFFFGVNAAPPNFSIIPLTFGPVFSLIITFS